MDEKKDQAIEILVELAEDFITGTRSYDLFESQRFRILIKNPSMINPMLNTLRRMTLSHIFMALCKFKEWYDKFKNEIPDDCKNACRAIRQKFEHKGIVNFRNTRIGHIWDNARDRPVTADEIDEIIDPGFPRWIHDFHASHSSY